MLDLIHDFRMLAQVCFRIFASLADLVAAVCEPCAALLDDADGSCQIQNVSFFGDSFSEHDIKFCLAERRSYFVFHDFDSGTVSDHLSALL